MSLSQTSQYAVRAAIYLAERGGSEPGRVSEIAEALEIPRNYLSKILHQLARGGVLTSERGPKGGFRLAASPADLCLADVIELVDPGFTKQRCLLGRLDCRDVDPCALHEHWKDLAGRIHGLLKDTTLADLVRAPEARP